MLAEKGRFRATFIRDVAGRQAPLVMELLQRARAAGRLRKDLDVSLAALSLMSLCIFPFLARTVAGPVLGLKYDDEEIERSLHTRRGCSWRARPRRRVRSITHETQSPFTVSALALVACSDSYDGQILGTLERDRLELIAEPTSASSRSRCAKATPSRRARQLVRQEARHHAAASRSGRRRAANVAEHRLAELVEGPRAQEIDEARAALDGADSSLETETQRVSSASAISSSASSSSQSSSTRRARGATARAVRDKQHGAAHTAARRHAQSRARPGPLPSLKQAQAALVELQPARRAISCGRRAPDSSKPCRTSSASGRRRQRRWSSCSRTARPMHACMCRSRCARSSMPGTRRHACMSMAATRHCAASVRYVSAEAAFTPYFALTQKDRRRLAYLALSRSRRARGREPAGRHACAGPPRRTAPVERSTDRVRAGHQRARPDAPLRRAHRGRSRRPRHSARADLRLPRTERLGQVDDDPHAVRPAAADRRRVEVLGHRCRATPSSCARSSAT